ncbi:putative reverse transcriptase domain-containing protein [Tanacetum coccineum]
MTNTRSGMTHAAIEEMIEQRVNAALEAHQVNQNLELGNGNGNGNNNGNGNGNDNGNGNGNDNGNGNGNDKWDMWVSLLVKCTTDCMKDSTTSFKGTEGVVGLIRWSEKMETVFHISNCPEKYQVKYATCTLLDSALTWWNSYKRTIGTDAAYALSWRELMKLMTEVYCPRNEIQKMETELWNLSVKNNDIASYTQRFQELTMMCTKMVPEEEDRVEKFIGGLPDNIQGNVIAAEPTRLQDAVRIANNLMDQKLKGYAVRNAENKRRLDNNYGNNRGQQPPHKRQNTGGQNVARAYVAGNNEVKKYEGHPFNIDLMPIELGSFDVIIGMDWLARNHAVIVCDEKIVRIPYGEMNLISSKEDKVTVKEDKTSRGESDFEDVPMYGSFTEVFPKRPLPGLPPVRQVEFQIDLVPGAAPVARAPYRLCTVRDEDLFTQLQELLPRDFYKAKFPPWGGFGFGLSKRKEASSEVYDNLREP